MNIFKVFTDGSVSNNGRDNAKGGIGVFFNDNNPDNLSLELHIPNITNNICELEACIRAINIIINKKEFIDNKNKNKIIIYTDSKYVINSIIIWFKDWEKNNWKNSKNEPVKNLNFIKKLRDYYLKYDIEFIFIKAHKKKPNNDIESIEYKEWYGNKMADKLAVDSHSIVNNTEN